MKKRNDARTRTAARFVKHDEKGETSNKDEKKKEKKEIAIKSVMR